MFQNHARALRDFFKPIQLLITTLLLSSDDECRAVRKTSFEPSHCNRYNNYNRQGALIAIVLFADMLSTGRVFIPSVRLVLSSGGLSPFSVYELSDSWLLCWSTRLTLIFCATFPTFQLIGELVTHVATCSTQEVRSLMIILGLTSLFFLHLFRVSLQFVFGIRTPDWNGTGHPDEPCQVAPTNHDTVCSDAQGPLLSWKLIRMPVLHA